MKKYLAKTLEETSIISCGLRKDSSAPDCVLPSDCDGNHSLRYQNIEHRFVSCERIKLVKEIKLTLSVC